MEENQCMKNVQKGSISWQLKNPVHTKQVFNLELQ